MTDRVVLDASAAAAVLFGEEECEEVLLLAGDAALVAPQLLPFELSNVAWKKASRVPEKRETILEALRLLGSLGIQLLEIDPVEAAQLALETKLTAYDASYLLLSRRLGVPLITLDGRMKKVRR